LFTQLENVVWGFSSPFRVSLTFASCNQIVCCRRQLNGLRRTAGLGRADAALLQQAALPVSTASC
jgi:hypothetical protein